MALLKVFADDSGDPADPQHSMMSIAGYVAKPEEWGLFEFEWDATLKMHRVPYLHMKEWWNRDGIYKELKEDAQKEALFFSDLVNLIEKHTEFCISATIVLRDFERFNEESGLGLDPYSFALYVCLIDLRKRYSDDDIEIVIDRISTPYKRIQLAKQYARTDTFEDLKVENIQMFPLEKTDSFKKIFPIQAADFMAWELRKISEERKDWSPSDNARVNLEAVQEDYRSWAKQFNESRGRFPRQRKSAQRLERATPQKGYVWDLFNIRAADSVRHKTGWRD